MQRCDSLTFCVALLHIQNDILMGRGGKNNQHSGNDQLRALAREECRNYRTASKKGKSYISRELVRSVRGMHPPGRFLKKNNDTGLWEDVGDDVAREKASQALRDAVAIVQSEEHDSDDEEEEEEEVDVQPIPVSQAIRRSCSAPPIMDKSPNDNERRKMWAEQPPPQRRQSEHFHPHEATTSHYPPVTPSTRQSSASKRRRFYDNNSAQSPWMGYHPPESPPYASPDQIASSRSNPEFSYPARPDFQPSRSYPTQQMRRMDYNQHHQAQNRGPPLLGEVDGEDMHEFDLFNGQLLEPPEEEEKSLERRSDTF